MSQDLYFVWVLHISEAGSGNVTQGHSPVQGASKVCDKCQCVWCYCGPILIYWLHIFLFPFCFHQSSYSSFMPTASHKYFLRVSSIPPFFFLHRFTSLPFVWPAFSFEWICFVPLVSAQANLPHRHSFDLLFHPPTLGKTVCSKDCNLTANLYGFLWGRALSLAEGFAKDVETPWSLRGSLQAEFEGCHRCASCH